MAQIPKGRFVMGPYTILCHLLFNYCNGVSWVNQDDSSFSVHISGMLDGTGILYLLIYHENQAFM